MVLIFDEFGVNENIFWFWCEPYSGFKHNEHVENITIYSTEKNF